MGRTLFIGDSHASGYFVDEKGISRHWRENNYGEIYSKVHNKPVVIYALPGASNQKYPIWIKAMFDYYKDIDEVFVQTSYWNRYLIACSKNLNSGDGMSANHFSNGPNPPPSPENTPLIERWADIRITEEHIELVEQCRPELFEKFKGLHYNESDITSNWSPFNEKYAYTKLWHESLTHLQYREYCGNLYIIDNMCKEYGVNWFLWNINDRVYIPKNYEFFGILKNCTKCDMSAQEYIKKHYRYDIDDKTLDSEHYFYDTHKIIATDYLEHLKNLSNYKL